MELYKLNYQQVIKIRNTHSALELLQALNDENQELIDKGVKHESVKTLINYNLNTKQVTNLRNTRFGCPAYTTCLCFASQFNTVEIVRQLVDAGADVSVTDSMGLTPLHRCCLSKVDTKQKVEFLLSVTPVWSMYQTEIVARP